MSMSKVLLALTSATLIGLSGCAGTETKPAEPPKAALSDAAKAALASAEAAHKDANAKFALWTTADDALKAAKAAAEKGDSETVIKQSKRVEEQAKLGIAQLNYPVLKLGD